MNVNRRTENRNLNRTVDWQHRGIRRAARPAPLALDIGKEIVCVCLPHRFSGRIKIGRARSVAPICVDADAMKTKVV